jgi:ATP/maltotriose-dependent transcriptional regulator MalT
LHVALSCLSNALCAAGELDEASATIQRNKQLAQHISPLFFRYAAWDEIRFNLVKGNITAAAQMFAEVESMGNHEDKIGWFLLTKAYLLYAQERYGDVLSVLDEPIRDLEQKGVYWYLMKLLPLQALALQALGRSNEALKVIGHCLSLAEPEGYVRIFVERGIPMRRLLQAASHRGIHTEYINKLLPAIKMTDSSQRPSIPMTSLKDQSPALIEPLSERELQVLRLLHSAMTSEEISRELFISVNTVHTHIRNIFGKLSVHGRIEAIQKAEDLDLI